MGKYTLKITNNTNSNLFVRGYSSSINPDEWYMSMPDGIANSTDLKLNAEEFTHELSVGESYTFVMNIDPNGIYDSTVYENVSFIAAICCSATNNLPSSVYAYFSRNNLNQVSLNVRYTSSAATLSNDFVAKGGFYKSVTGKNIRAINGSNEKTITNVVVGNAQTLVNASSWWLNLIPSSANIIMNNVLVRIFFFVIIIAIAFKKIVPKLFDMIEDKDEKKKKRKRKYKSIEDDSDF